MTRELAVTIVLGVAVLLILLGVLGWWRRTRRDAGITAPVGEIPEGAAVGETAAVLYVATTRHGEPLERLAIRGLGFRSRADLTLTDAGLALDLTGQPRIFLARDRVTGIAQATVAIDRVVERDGLVRVTWLPAEGTPVDTYLRPQESSARALADAITGILTPTQTGTDT